MWLSDISIKRPVLATVMSLIIVLLGTVSIFQLPVREFPDIDPPIVSVITVYPGASPETIEATVTEPLEDEIASIEGIKTLSSFSKEQVSQIVIEFELSRDVDVAAQDVRDRVARARAQLPQDDVEEPIISKEDADAQAIIWLGLAGKNYTRLQLSDYADKFLKDTLQTVPGVGKVIIGGEREYAMRLWLDPWKMASRGISQKDVEDALRDQNVDLPSGRIESRNTEFTVKFKGDMASPEVFNNLIVKNVNGTPVYLKEIGYAKIGAKDDRSLVRYQGQPAVGLGIVKQSKANTLDVAKGIKSRVAGLQSKLPPGMILEPAFDSSLYIDRAIKEVKESLLVSGLLVLIVIFFFLGSVRASIIPAVSIPVSIIGTFAVMQAFGFTINIFTLLALTLSIGLVVDDSIVVLENIIRHIEMGKTPFQAALEGTSEIAFAILATTVTLVAVFIPIGFATGTTGRLFFEFAIAVSAAVLISGFVSLSLSPMMSSKLLNKDIHAKVDNPNPSRIQKIWKATTGFLDHWLSLYKGGLQWSLIHPKLVLAMGAFTILLSVGLFKILPSDFLPLEDQGSIFTIISAPEGATMEFTDKAVRQAEAVFKSVPEVSKTFAVIALSMEGPGQVNSGMMFTMLKPAEERKKKQQKIVEEIFPLMMSIPEAFVFSLNPPSGPNSGFRGSVQMVLQGFDVQELYQASQAIIKRAQTEVPGLIQLDTDVKLNKPQLEVKVLRERAAALGVTPAEMARALQVLLGGQSVTDFKMASKRYDVVLQAPPAFRNAPEAIQSIMVHGKEDQLIPLANLVQIKESVAPNSLNHYNRLRSVTITGSTIPFLTTLGQALDKLETIAKEELPSKDVQIAFAGESKEYKDAGYAFIWTFAFAVLVIYLVLAAQFESFKHPFIILLTVPLAVTGALLSLFIANGSVNVYSQIGIVLLIGLVTKNGILIVEYANQLREQGLLVRDAIYQAAAIRFRPIVMTSIATIVGAVPIAFALGAGSESRQTLGIAIIGGLLFSTFLTLFVIPVVYELLNPDKSDDASKLA